MKSPPSPALPIAARIREAIEQLHDPYRVYPVSETLRALASEIEALAGEMRAESSGGIRFMDEWAARLAGEPK